LGPTAEVMAARARCRNDGGGAGPLAAATAAAWAGVATSVADEHAAEWAESACLRPEWFFWRPLRFAPPRWLLLLLLLGVCWPPVAPPPPPPLLSKRPPVGRGCVTPPPVGEEGRGGRFARSDAGRLSLNCVKWLAPLVRVVRPLVFALVVPSAPAAAA
jgi:hypothetical protein